MGWFNGEAAGRRIPSRTNSHTACRLLPQPASPGSRPPALPRSRRKAERIHIFAPVPGKSSVGVEVPNPVKTKVIMRDLFESEEWRNTKAKIPIALGKDVYGHPIVADLAEMPHLLIAGSTGSGKSVCINAIIASLLYRFSPDQLRFVMIDPKVVELQQYNALPHLVVPVVTDPKKVILALRWVVNEMEKRYQIFARVGVRNIESFNERPKKQTRAAGTRTAAHGQEGKSRAGRGRFRRRSGRGNRRAARGGHRHSRKTFLHRRHH